MSPAPAGYRAPLTRCAVHPARRASDECPVCGRARCAPDAATYAERGCAACVSEQRPAPPAPALELLLRSCLASLGVGFLGAWVAAQYVDTQFFGVIVPGLVGLACAWAASAAAGTGQTPPDRRRALLVAAVTAVLATGLSDRLVPGGQNLFLPPGHRLPPYLAAIVGAFAWPVLFGPPRSERHGTKRSDPTATFDGQPAGRGIRRK